VAPTIRAVTRRLPHALRYYGQVLRLPPRVAWFYVRARRTAARRRDGFSLSGALPPQSMRPLLAAAAPGTRHVVEIGTGTAWAAIGLALADPERGVVSYDPVARPEREVYLELAGAVRDRIELREQPGEAGPRPGDPSPGLVFVDGSHERERTIRTFEVWRDALVPGGAIAFHDYGNAAYPGVTAAIEELGLEGEVVGDLFVWRKR
jgi:predicted O-methyltransferase YrrM